MKFNPHYLLDRRSGRRIMLSGCRPSNKAPSRARRYATNRFGARELPAKIDLRPHLTPIEDQAESNSCTANAVAGAYEYLLQQLQGETFDVSRLFIYYNARHIDGAEHEDQGSSIASAIESLSNYGACHESWWPYYLENVNTIPSEEAYENAVALMLDEALQIDVDLFAMKHCLAEGYPFIFGLNLFESFDRATRQGRVPLPDPNGPARESHGLHAMLAVGYSDHNQSFVVRNSWGTSWGDRGYCYIPYDYMANPQLCGDLWSIRAIQNAMELDHIWSEEDDGFFDPEDNSFDGYDSFDHDFDYVQDDSWDSEQLDLVSSIFAFFGFSDDHHSRQDNLSLEEDQLDDEDAYIVEFEEVFDDGFENEFDDDFEDDFGDDFDGEFDENMKDNFDDEQDDDGWY